MKTVLFLLVVLICGSILAWFREEDIKAYNRGRCKTCGGPLTHFDTDSQGGRGYVCYSCIPHNYVCWISYPWVDHKHVNPVQDLKIKINPTMQKRIGK